MNGTLGKTLAANPAPNIVASMGTSSSATGSRPSSSDKVVVLPAAFVSAVERPSQDQRRQGAGWVVAGAAAAPLIGVPVLT